MISGLNDIGKYDKLSKLNSNKHKCETNGNKV